MDNTCGEQTETRPKLDADRAAWLKDRLHNLADLVRVLNLAGRRKVTADDEMREMALEGAIHGQAREIARLLGYEPGENLGKEDLVVEKMFGKGYTRL